MINTGNANAGTGEPGLAGARADLRRGGAPAGHRAEQVLPFSTGVIIEPLPVERMVAGLPGCPGRPQGRPLARRCPRHHDHRHRAQGRLAPGQARRQDRDRDRHLQGRRHDQARTWRPCWASSPPMPASRQPLLPRSWSRRRPTPPSTASRSMATPRPTTRFVLIATGQAGNAPVTDAGQRRRPGAAAAVIAVSRRTGAGHRARRRRRHQVHHRRASRAARPREECRKVALRHRATRRWSRPPSSPPTPTWAASWPRSATPASTTWTSGPDRAAPATTCWWPRRAAAPRATARKTAPRVMEQAEITVRVGLGRGDAQRHGLDLRLLLRLRDHQRRLPLLQRRHGGRPRQTFWRRASTICSRVTFSDGTIPASTVPRKPTRAALARVPGTTWM